MPAASVKEYPILMSGEMVRATLADLKTQTRRVAKPQPMKFLRGLGWVFKRFGWHGINAKATGWHFNPHGGPGDRLWVRETWGVWQRGDATPVRGQPYDPEVIYRADDECPDIPHDLLWEPFRWRPSIHMPKKLCRLWLEVKDVRIEPLQDITTEDIWAEGLQVPVSDDGGVLWRMAPSNAAGNVPASYLPGRLHPGQPPITTDEVARAHFADLWDSLNAKRGHPWEANDWVWRTEYERVEAPS